MPTRFTTTSETYLTQSFLEEILFSLFSFHGFILIHVVLISIIYCITEIISTRCKMLGDLSHEVSLFLWHLSLSQSCQPDRKKEFITNLLSKKYIFLKPKTISYPLWQLFSSLVTKLSLATLNKEIVEEKAFTNFSIFGPV